jgi:hypothetical protein
MMSSRRRFVLMFTSAFVALAVVTSSVIADELMGMITKINADAKKITVTTKDDKEVEVTITDTTEWVTKKGSSPIDLEKVAGNLKKAQDAGRKGIMVTVTHENAVASKIAPAAKKKTD